MATFQFTQGDQRPFFAVQIMNTLTNEAVSLTGATVTFNFKNDRSRTAKVTGGSCTVTDAANGKVEYRWASTDLDEPGIYTAEFVVAHTDTKVQSVVIENVEVRAQLG